MTAPPDLSALVAAVERAIREIPSAHANLPSLTKQFKSDAALLSRLAEALNGAQEAWQRGKNLHLVARENWEDAPSWHSVLVLPWEER